MIWDYALQESNPIHVNASFKLPGLLATCRQIRLDTYHAYFDNNEWMLRVHNMDPTVFRKWMQRIWISVPRQNTNNRSLRVTGTKQWQNLVTWLDLIFEAGTYGPLFMPMNEPQSKTLCAVHRAQLLVLGLALQGQSWVAYRALLPHIRGLLGLVHSDWLVDR